MLGDNVNTEISFEYFPPKTPEQQAIFDATHAELQSLNPTFFSVTFGAGGSTLEHTEQTVLAIESASAARAAPHISCLGGRRESVGRLLDTYKEAGISRIVALRGDMPSGMASAGEFRYANELVAYIRERHGDHFRIHVACYPEVHPEAETIDGDLNHFQAKVEAGADEAITQYFFNADSYFHFVDCCRDKGIDIPIVPGIMPITNYTQLARFSKMCGAELPRWLRKRLQSYGDDRASIRAFGIDFVSGLCQRLLEGGAPGLHFYTLNRAPASVAICKNLGIA